MIDFSLMNKALKCIWIKRFRLNENSAWTVIPNEATSHLGGFSFLSKCYCSSKDISIKELPLFYTRTLQYWFEFKDMQDTTKPDIKNMIIWNNRDIKIDKNTIFFRTWFSRGVSTIENLLDHNLDFITYEEFKTRYQINTNFLTYYGVINAISNEYKKSIKQTNAQQEQPSQQGQSLKALTTKAIRKIFVNHIFEVPTATQRLIDNGLPPDRINDYFNLAFSSTKETKLIMFQYKILHNIVFTKEKLFRAKIANSDLCYLCLETKQDLKHMLVTCQFVSEFWEAFLYWYKSRVSVGLELSTINILYGIIGNNHLNKLTNHLLLLAKYYIYCCSITEEPLLLSVYLTIVVNKAEIEKQIAVSVNSPEYYYNKWKPLIEKFVG